MKTITEQTYSQQLLKKWAPLIEAGAPIDSVEKKVALAKVLESTAQDFRRSGLISEEGLSTTDIAIAQDPKDGVLGPAKGDQPGNFDIPTIVMPMLRRIFPELMAHELVSVQPMNGPVGYAMAYRAQYNNADKQEIGYNTVLTEFTGVSGATEGTAEADWQAYAGTKEYNGIGTATKDGEWKSLDDGLPTVGFGLTKKMVEARTRKLAANWSPELAEDMMAMHGVNVEEEMMNTLSYEIGAEIDRQLLTTMVKAAITAGHKSVWTPVSADGLDQIGRIATLLTHLTVAAQDIAIKTRRSNANFVVASPKVTAVIQQLTANRFVGNEKANLTTPKAGIGALTKVGLINDGQQLLVRDTLAAGEYALLGLKGATVGDAGVIYCPYIPLAMQKIPAVSTDFTPAIMCRTRYGVVDSPWEAGNYYHFVRIDNLMASSYQLATGDRHFLATLG
jgi:hypothetical protein